MLNCPYMTPNYCKPVNAAPKTGFTTEEAIRVAKQLYIDFSKEKFDVEQFRAGLDVELEHGKRDPLTNVTGDNPILTGKIALAHLREFPDYYTRLAKLEEEAKAYWGIRNKYTPGHEDTKSSVDQWVRYIKPLVERAMKEAEEGINTEHLFQEFILAGVLIGSGFSPEQAIGQIEAWEKTGESKLLKESKMK